jgi:curli biogenesis system outer membrane secretion channel CsgG
MRLPLCTVGCLLAPAMLAACAQPSADGLAAAQPTTDAVRQATRYSGALACLRQHLAKAKGHSQFVTVGLIPDATGRITPGIRDMVSAAVVSATQGGVRFIPVEAAAVAGISGTPLGATATTLGLLVGPPVPRQNGPALPDNAALVSQSVQVVGALSQADKSVQQTNLQGGLGLGERSLGAGATTDESAVTLDLRLVDVQTGVVLQATSNALVVHNKGRSANAALTFGSLGISFDASYDRREGPHQAVRTLVDLSVGELLSRQAKIPFSKCLPSNAGAQIHT